MVYEVQSNSGAVGSDCAGGLVVFGGCGVTSQRQIRSFHRKAIR